jgi:diacylglycerol kinase family enzyme
MASPFGPIALIADTTAVREGVVAAIAGMEGTLRSQDLAFTVLEAADSGRAERHASEALRAGKRFLVAVGGDRVVHEVANAILGEPRAEGNEAVLGVVPLGTDCNFARTFGLPADPNRAAALLSGDRIFPIDAIRVEYLDAKGEQASRFSCNVAQVGFGAELARRRGRSGRRDGVRFFSAFWRAVLRTPTASVRVEAGKSLYEGRARGVVIGNGQYDGDGMRVSPRSWPGDGLLDVLVHTGPRSDAYTTLPLVYKGEQVPSPNIVEMKGRSIRVDSRPALSVSADGVFLGTTPAAFEVVRLGLRLKI